MYGHPSQAKTPPVLQAPVPQHSSQRIINHHGSAGGVATAGSSQYPHQQYQQQQQQQQQPYTIAGFAQQQQQQQQYQQQQQHHQQQQHQQQQYQQQQQQQPPLPPRGFPLQDQQHLSYPPTNSGFPSQSQQFQQQQQQHNGAYPSQHTTQAASSSSIGFMAPASSAYTQSSSSVQGPPPPANPTQQQPSSYLGSNFVNDFQGSAAGQIGMQLGTQAFTQVQQNVNQNLSRYINVSQLRYYFNVSNSYVLNKVRLLLFPFRHTSWSRLVHRSEHNGQAEGYAPPREDLNAPDLYLPVMSYVTYVLLVGLTIGMASEGAVVSKKFTPEVLGTSATGAFFIVFFEVFVLKLAFYLLNVVNDASFLDLISYCGYKFIFVSILVVFKSVLGMFDWKFWIPGAYLVLAFGFFTIRTLRYLVLPDQGTTNVVGRDGRKRRVLGLFVISAFQCLSMLALI
ncbi:hypothetical protein BASA60_007721 [Batrachochytrium salamandrivorans]|nr:hypothetical protein BASA60_007721 [Batrachochytrium salamandrivorans]KAH9257232.1 hypothetical protein BASA81_004623 [Batrachochytrium salamandrivorans]